MPSPLTKRLLTHLANQLANLPKPLYIALSGGMDSMLLLEAVSRLATPATAIHIHHGLQTEADQWQHFCEQQARQRGMAFQCHRVTLDANAGNVEAAARHARYQAFAQTVGQGSLLLAHHQDDQAETLLLRLERGSGVSGLKGMAPRSTRGEMTLARPLLNFSRQELTELAHQWKLDWVEDPSNADMHYARNRIRHNLLPHWQKHTPAIRRQLARTASHMAESQQLLDELAQQDADSLQDGQPGWSIGALQTLRPNRRRNLLCYWLADKEPWRPPVTLLQRIDAEMFTAAPDKRPQLPLQNGRLVRYQQRLYWLPEIVFHPPQQGADWLPDQPLQISALSLQPGEGDARHMLQLPNTPLGVRFAQGGEKLWLNGKHQRLTECWRSRGFPYWLRPWLPLFYQGDELVAVAGIGTGSSSVEQLKVCNWRLPKRFGIE